MVAPLDQANKLPAVGLMVRSMLPLAAPQSAGLIAEVIVIIGVLLPITKVPEEEHDAISVIVTEKDPALRFAISSVLALLDHRKVYVPDGVTAKSIDPLGDVQDVFATGIAVKEKLLLLFVTVNVSNAWQPFASVTITLYAAGGDVQQVFSTCTI
jgi:hypothetical protein